MNILIGIFLILHGFIHSSYLAPKPDDPKYPFNLDKGWFAGMIGDSAQIVGGLLVTATVVLLLLAGLAVLGVPGLVGLWKFLTVAGAISSLAVLLLFWHNWLIVGVIIDIVLLFGLAQLGWDFTK